MLFRQGIHLHKFLLTTFIPHFINNLSIVLYMSGLIHNSIDTTYYNCVHISMVFFLQICVHYCIDVVVVEIYSIHLKKVLFSYLYLAINFRLTSIEAGI